MAIKGWVKWQIVWHPVKPPKSATKMGAVNLIGAPIYRIKGMEGEWVRHLVEPRKGKEADYLEELEEHFGKLKVVMLGDEFFIRRN